MARLLAARCEEEIAKMHEVLAELERSIRAALDDEPHWEQISILDSEPERFQLIRNREALNERLTAIPDQKKTETEALRRRYADPRDHWFPAAVTFLVPSAIARGGAR